MRKVCLWEGSAGYNASLAIRIDGIDRYVTASADAEKDRFTIARESRKPWRLSVSAHLESVSLGILYCESGRNMERTFRFIRELNMLKASNLI